MSEERARELSSREELRDRIVVSATTEFVRNGIRSITMDDVASRLGISKRTLYEVFPDKETLLKECALYRRKEFRFFVESVLKETDNVLEVILRCYQRTIEDFHRTNIRFYEDLKRYPKVRMMWKENQAKDSEDSITFLKKGVKQGIFRADVNYEIVNFLAHEQLSILMNTEVCNAYSFLDMYESIMFTLLRGISTEKGYAELERFVQEYRKKRQGASPK